MSCKKKSIATPVEIYRPCDPSPCGANTLCKENNGAGSCTCMQNYYGDPHIGCRPECIQNSDCSRHLSCVNTKCVDPCPGACGLNAECTVDNHSPVCYCLNGYTGNPSRMCQKIEISKFLMLISSVIARFQEIWKMILLYTII